MVECDYCGTTDLAYKLESGRGPVVARCIPCLAVERAQPGVGWRVFSDYDDELQQHVLENANDYLRVLARYRTDDPLIKRDPDDIGTVSENARTFLTNVMGADAHKRPSELTESGGDE